MKKRIVLVIALLLFAGQLSSVKADDVSDLKFQMRQMQLKISQLEAAQKTQEQKIDEKISKAVDDKQITLPDSLKWAENIKFSGDLRYRHESIDDDTKTTKRNRNRIRARLKMKAKINDEWDATIRLATGSSDSPTSTNQTLGDSGSDSFSSKEFWLDQAYASYHPKWKPGLNILLGKMGNPFYKVGKNQLIFDGDLSLEGGAASYKFDLADATSMKLTAGSFWLRERSTDADTSLFGIQALLKHKLSKASHILVGVSYYDFGNIQGMSLDGISSKGNTTLGGLFVNDYDLVEGFGEYGFELGSRPVAVYGNYVKNIAATTSEDTAWLIGVKYNKAKKPGSWEASYNYRDVEKDAVVGGLCDSDFVGGGTDGKGHVFGFKYQIAKNVQGGLHYFINEKNASTTGDNFRLLQADLIFKF